MRAPVFPCVCDYRIHLVVRAIPLTLKLLELLRCDVPVSSTLAESMLRDCENSNLGEGTQSKTFINCSVSAKKIKLKKLV